MRKPNEHGVAVVAVLLMILAITALAQGALLLARAQWGVAESGARLLQLEGAADGVLALTLQEPLGGRADSLGVWEVDTALAMQIGSVPATGFVRRLAAEAWLLEGVAGSAEMSPVRARRLAWAPDPLTRVSALEAVVTVGSVAPVEVEGQIDGDAPLDRRSPLSPDACRRWEPQLSDVFGRVSIPPVLRVERPPSLGLLKLDSLLARTETHLAGLGTPGPVVRFGRCDVSVVWNWGSPDDPNGPCGSHTVLRASPGDLVVDGGVGQGVLVTAGDIDFRRGARFYGLVLAGGRLAVEDDVVLEGLFVAAGGLRVARPSRVLGSACWALKALDAARGELGGLLLVPEVGRLGSR